MDIITEHYLKTATDLGIPVTANEMLWFITVSFGEQRHTFSNNLNSLSRASSIIVCNIVHLNNILLKKAGLPVVEMMQIRQNEADIININLPYPLSIRPATLPLIYDRSVFNIRNQTTLICFIKQFLDSEEAVVVETFTPDLITYQVLLCKHRIISALRLKPACVTGDGIHTIEQLIGEENQKRTLLSTKTNLGYLWQDEDCTEKLKDMQLNLQSIPSENENVILTDNPHPYNGGSIEALDINRIHPNIKQQLIKASYVLDLELVSFDVSCFNISESPDNNEKLFIRPNCFVDITHHENPMTGKGTPVSKIIFESILRKHPVAYLKHLMKIMD